MSSDKIIETIEKYCEVKEDRKFLKCSDAFKVAKELKINVSEVGKICNENKIKIMGCQLGCF